MKTALIAILLMAPALKNASRAQTAPHTPADDFRTAGRCLTCHNNLKTAKGEDVSIGVDWSASIMANAARDPYWQGSVRRETLDHPESSAAIQSECASCHAPLQVPRRQGPEPCNRDLQMSPARRTHDAGAAAADGVSCNGLPSDPAHRPRHTRNLQRQLLRRRRRQPIRGHSSAPTPPKPTTSTRST